MTVGDLQPYLFSSIGVYIIMYLITVGVTLMYARRHYRKITGSSRPDYEYSLVYETQDALRGGTIPPLLNAGLLSFTLFLAIIGASMYYSTPMISNDGLPESIADQTWVWVYSIGLWGFVAAVGSYFLFSAVFWSRYVIGMWWHVPIWGFFLIISMGFSFLTEIAYIASNFFPGIQNGTIALWKTLVPTLITLPWIVYLFVLPAYLFYLTCYLGRSTA